MQTAAAETGKGANQVLEACSDLSRQSEFLRLEVSKFLTQVRGDVESAGTSAPEQEAA